MNQRVLLDRFVSKALGFFTASSCLLTLIIIIALYFKAKFILDIKPLSHLLLSSSWHPFRGEFGFYAFIMGTLWVTALAMILAVPVSILAAIYLSEYAQKRTRELASPLLDLLAGIPSVVFGVCGILIIVPLIKDFIGPLCGVSTTGYSVLAAGIVLAVMVVPVITSILVEVFSAIPKELRDSSLALGATKWQTIKHTLLRKAMPGVVAAMILGFSRAFGETMAVLMVAGNVARAPSSIFDPAYPLPALIANNYGEMLSLPMYDSALMLASLILLASVLFFNILARLVLTKIEGKYR
jgi:phosphate transport system permease protein